MFVERGLKAFRKDKPQGITTAYGFDGKPVTLDRNVMPIKHGFIYEKPALADGKYWGSVPRQDFFYSGQIIYEENCFLTNLEQEVWKATIRQLVLERGPNPNLDEVNILNTHYTYQTQRERLPLSVIKKIQQRTKVELEKLGPSLL